MARKETQYTNFLCNLAITRKLTIGETQETLKSSFHKFFNEAVTSYISVGNCPTNNIIVETLTPNHFKFNFQNDSMVIMGNGKGVEISTGNINKKLDAGEIFRIPFEPKVLSDEGNLLEWKLEIHPDLSIHGNLYMEAEFLPEDDIKALELLYGPLKKISESRYTSVYQNKGKRIIKVLNPAENKYKSHFLNAAKTLESFSGDCLCKIKKIVKEPVCHSALSYFPGTTLENYLAQKGRLSYKGAIFTTRKILKILKDLEAKDFSLEYLLPENILRRKDGLMQLMAWNTPIADAILNGEKGQFLAPEYLETMQNSTASHIFSLGMIFYQLITGKLLFANIEEYQQMLESENYIDQYYLQQSSPRITAQLSELLESMLSFMPEDRPDLEETSQWLKEIKDVGTKKQEVEEPIQVPPKPEKARFGLQFVTSVKDLQGKIIPIKETGITTIGRTGDIAIEGDFNISRQHAQITIKNEQGFIEDLKSVNGVLIDGEKIQGLTRLENGSIFSIGASTICFWDFEHGQNKQKELDEKLESKEPESKEVESKEPESKKAETQKPDFSQTMARPAAGRRAQTEMINMQDLATAKQTADIKITQPSIHKEGEEEQEEVKDGYDKTSGKLKSKKLQEFYQTLAMDVMVREEVPIAKPKRSHTSPLAGGKAQNDAKLRELHKNLAIGLAVAVFLFFILFFYAFMVRVEPVKVPTKPKPLKNPLVEKTKQQKKKRHKVLKKYKKDRAFLRAIMQKLFIPKTPDQLFINSLLKKIHLEGKEYFQGPLAGDFHNITARLYFYKIFLDRDEDLFEPHWKNIWRKEISINLQMALKKYQDPICLSDFQLLIMPWMPEKKMYGKSIVVRYKNTQEAVKDMEVWIAKTK